MRSKLVPLPEAVAVIRSGSSLALGGSLLRRQPMAVVRELLRQGTTDLTLLTWATSVATDQLVAAGRVRAWEGIYVGMWWRGLAPAFRRAVQDGAVQVTDRSESYMTARFRAAAMGLPFLPVRPIRGTVTGEQPDVADVQCPHTGDRLHAVAAARPDVTVLHGYEADEHGNVAWPVHRDSDDLDLIMSAGARHLVVTVERVVPHAQVAARPNLTYIPHTKVDAVCEVPYGAWPSSCDTEYDEDAAELDRWTRACRTPAGAEAYLEETATGVAGHDALLERVGRERLDRLAVREGAA